MGKRASLEELKEFANRVREAGGGNPLDALMPAVPEDATACLIAKNLNFNCSVGSAGPKYSGSRWGMWVDDLVIRDAIAEKLNLERIGTTEEMGKTQYGVLLPEEIGQVARDYDAISEVYGEIADEIDCISYDLDRALSEDEQRRLALDVIEASRFSLDEIQEFWPYIEESVREAYGLATFVTEDGRIVI